VGVDFSRGMLQICRRQTVCAPGLAQVELVCGNALALPFGPAFDLVTCFGAVGHIRAQDQTRFASEIARVLRPGGRFVFVTSFAPPLSSPDYWLARLFNGAMRLRNWLVAPPFIMYYLTFLVPDVLKLLRRQGFAIEVRELGLCPAWSRLRLVLATRTAAGSENRS
jgi:SAM-dependent methyltransferase